MTCAPNQQREQRWDHETIERAVVDALDAPPAWLSAPSRSGPERRWHARCVYAYLLHTACVRPYSTPEIARLMGVRAHSAVLNMIRVVREALDDELPYARGEAVADAHRQVVALLERRANTDPLRRRSADTSPVGNGGGSGGGA